MCSRKNIQHAADDNVVLENRTFDKASWNKVQEINIKPPQESSFDRAAWNTPNATDP